LEIRFIINEEIEKAPSYSQKGRELSEYKEESN